MAESDPERIVIEITREPDIVTARQAGRNLAMRLGFGAVMQSRIATSISELARNIYLFAKAGTITIAVVEVNGKKGVQITAEDSGPGIPDIRKALEDGYSTIGALGAGLPGVKRMMDDFFIQSKPQEGTQVVVVKWCEPVGKGGA
ncbi:anti-sigma regulatory factor [Brevibacillus sp. TJ4]|uniref:anti-sigma regulatory factor n=1 Tax=Brevibacillus sp. TJ4 TaxID=3234853 RepID=UPI003BA250C0